MWMLNSLDKCPPGEFYYPRPAGSAKKYWKSPIIREVAKAIAAYRQGNGLPRATETEALEDVISYTCERLGHSKDWVFDTEKTFSEMLPQIAPGCSTCGAVIE